MPWIETQKMRLGMGPTGNQNLQLYNGLDCCLTLEIHEELREQYGTDAHSNHGRVYRFERALQGPYMDIMQKGFYVDEQGRREASVELRQRLYKLNIKLNVYASVIWGKGLNARSPKQLQEFFYGALALPEIWISQKGVKKLSINREVLEKLSIYLFARPFVNIILTIRDLAKQLEVFEKEIDVDQRFRAGYNIAGTETGRPSSSTNAFGTASNAQNIAPGQRHVLVADPGHKLCVIDLAQVEARDVGFFCGCLFDEWTFLNNCEDGDLHTLNAKRIWSELPWPGDPKGDREIADRIFYREFTFRDMAKRGSHLSNYYGTAWTAARSLKTPIEVMEEFQARYIRGRPAGRKGPAITPAFPEIARWWAWTANELQLRGKLVTPFGRTRHFFGRPDDDTTLREAIAFLPQSTTADRMNLALLRLWLFFRTEIRLLAQTYDSVTFQYHEDADEDAIIKEALAIIESVRLYAPNNNREYFVPGEAKIGWNWGNYADEADIAKALKNGRRAPRLNLDGLKKWSPKEPDQRKRGYTPRLLQLAA